LADARQGLRRTIVNFVARPVLGLSPVPHHLSCVTESETSSASGRPELGDR
jgi:hypothetical protein